MRTLSVIGARPQFVKLAPVSRAMAASGALSGREIEDIIVHTGQHYDHGMSEIFFDQLEIPRPAVDLGVGSGTHGIQTARMLESIEAQLKEYTPDVVIVYGDTNSTLAAALAAAKLHIPVAHIEAGLRSFDRDMPEEVNRVVSDHVADLLYAPTETAMQNLRDENLADRARLVGDVMLDAVLQNDAIAQEKSHALEDAGLEEGGFAIATLHRAANTEPDVLRVLLDALNGVAADGLTIVFPLHPRTSARIETDHREWVPSENLRVMDPVGYLDMLRLLRGARIAMTDSGGLQKEAFFLGTPCITLRDETEWTETTDADANILVGADPDRIHAAVDRWRSGGIDRAAIRDRALSAFGGGDAAKRIVADLAGSVQAAA